MMLEKLASGLGRVDEEANIDLAIALCNTKNSSGIKEIVAGLQSKDKSIANDCIKVLYEIGQREAELIGDYADVFIKLLASKNNRLVWGSMTALQFVAQVNADRVYQRIDQIINAYQNGSVITIDNSMSVFAELCKSKPVYMKEIFPLLIDHLMNCRVKEVPQHAERISVCITNESKADFFAVIEERIPDMSPLQKSRINKLKKSFKE